MMRMPNQKASPKAMAAMGKRPAMPAAAAKGQAMAAAKKPAYRKGGMVKKGK